MSSILKKLCKNLNIELIYTNNKITILSCSAENHHPIIRVHKMLKDCNEGIANAIIGYYTKIENEEENLKVIQDYLDKTISTKKYKIIPRNIDFISAVINGITPKKSAQNASSNLAEMEISSITKKSFYDSEYIENPDDSLKVSADDILEVNIVVNPFNT